MVYTPLYPLALTITLAPPVVLKQLRAVPAVGCLNGLGNVTCKQPTVCVPQYPDQIAVPFVPSLKLTTVPVFTAFVTVRLVT